MIRHFVLIGIAIFSLNGRVMAAPQFVDNCLQSKNWALRIDGCTKVLSRMRQTDVQVEAFTNRGEGWLNTFHPENAIADFDKALSLNPHYFSAYLLRASAWRDRGDPKRAKEDYTEAIHLNRLSATAYEFRGKVELFELNDPDAALADFVAAIELAPQRGMLHALLSDYYRNRGDLDRASSEIDKAVALDPHNEQILQSRALTMIELREFDLALSDIDEAIRLNTSNPNQTLNIDYATRGTIWRLKGDLDRALADSNKSISILSNSAVGLAWRGDIYRYRGEFKLALATIIERCSWPPILFQHSPAVA